MAITDFDRCILSRPNYYFAYIVRGEARVGTKSFEKAIADFNKAILLNPTDHSAFASPAWFRATCSNEKYRDGKKAVKLATTACELSGWKDSEDLGTIAAAYAEEGEFDQAIKWQEEAIKLVEVSDFTELKEKKERLALYKDKKPYHEP